MMVIWLCVGNANRASIGFGFSVKTEQMVVHKKPQAVYLFIYIYEEDQEKMNVITVHYFSSEKFKKRKGFFAKNNSAVG